MAVGRTAVSVDVGNKNTMTQVIVNEPVHTFEGLRADQRNVALSVRLARGDRVAWIQPKFRRNGIGSYLVAPGVFATYLLQAAITAREEQLAMHLSPIFFRPRRHLHILQASFSPPAARMSIVASLHASRRPVFVRRCRRFTSILEESTMELVTPRLARYRCSQKPSRPASSQLHTGALADNPKCVFARATSVSRVVSTRAAILRTSGGRSIRVVIASFHSVLPSSKAPYEVDGAGETYGRVAAGSMGCSFCERKEGA